MKTKVKKSNKNESVPQAKLPAPDGGYGWVVLVASFVSCSTFLIKLNKKKLIRLNSLSLLVLYLTVSCIRSVLS